MMIFKITYNSQSLQTDGYVRMLEESKENEATEEQAWESKQKHHTQNTLQKAFWGGEKWIHMLQCRGVCVRVLQREVWLIWRKGGDKYGQGTY